MGRYVEITPPGACDACGKPCITLDQVGIRCFHCHAGVFMSRQWFTFWRDDFGRWIATPREDLDVVKMEADRERVRGQAPLSAVAVIVHAPE